MIFNSALVSLVGLLGLVRGTKLHVNTGCIDVDGYSICGSRTNWIDGLLEGKATISARFSGNWDKKTEMPGCVLPASWPSDYGDIYFGEDNCLYDSNGQRIYNQCCLEKATQEVTNPTWAWYGQGW